MNKLKYLSLISYLPRNKKIKGFAPPLLFKTRLSRDTKCLTPLRGGIRALALSLSRLFSPILTNPLWPLADTLCRGLVSIGLGPRAFPYPEGGSGIKLQGSPLGEYTPSGYTKYLLFKILSVLIFNFKILLFSVKTIIKTFGNKNVSFLIKKLNNKIATWLKYVVFVNLCLRVLRVQKKVDLFNCSSRLFSPILTNPLWPLADTLCRRLVSIGLGPKASVVTYVVTNLLIPYTPKGYITYPKGDKLLRAEGDKLVRYYGPYRNHVPVTKGQGDLYYRMRYYRIILPASPLGLAGTMFRLGVPALSPIPVGDKGRRGKFIATRVGERLSASCCYPYRNFVPVTKGRRGVLLVRSSRLELQGAWYVIIKPEGYLGLLQGDNLGLLKGTKLEKKVIRVFLKTNKGLILKLSTYLTLYIHKLLWKWVYSPKGGNCKLTRRALAAKLWIFIQKKIKFYCLI